MTPTPSFRETAICPHCGLHQFIHGASCPRCRNTLNVEFLRLDVAQLHRQMADENSHALPHSVGLTLRQLRARRGISQEELVRMAGVSVGRSHLSRIESGYVEAGLATLLRVAGGLGLTAIILRFDRPGTGAIPPDQPRS